MRPGELLDLGAWVVIIDLVGGLMLVGHVVAAVAALVRGRALAARLLVADGAVLALSFKVAGSLLKTLELRSWTQILAFSAILGLRVLLKRLFTWEQERVARRLATAETARSSQDR